jgi:hypothetical protein
MKDRLVRRALRRLAWICVFYLAVGCLGIALRLSSGRSPGWEFPLCAALSLAVLAAAVGGPRRAARLSGHRCDGRRAPGD